MIQITLNDLADVDSLKNMVSGLLSPGKMINISISLEEQCYLQPVVETIQQNEPINIEEAISNILLEIGIPNHILGYRYTTVSLKKVIKDPEKIKTITKSLYPEIATEFKTTPSRVERAIRHAIKIAWSPINIETNNRLFGNTINSSTGRPTNSAFIALLADRIRRQLNLA